MKLMVITLITDRMNNSTTKLTSIASRIVISHRDSSTNPASINQQILANGLCLLCCYKWDSDPDAAFAEEDNIGGGIGVEEDEGIAISSESSGRSDEPIIALRNVEPLQVRTGEQGFENDVIYYYGQ